MSTYCLHPTNQVCNACDFDKASELANEKLRQLDYDELALILRMAIARTDYSAIASVLAEFGCDMLPQETYERMLQTRIMRGDYSLANHAAQIAGRELTPEECDRLAYNALYFNSDTGQIVRMLQMGKISPAGILSLITVCLDRALPQMAGALAEKIGHRFSALEIERLHQSCERLEFTDRLVHVYQLPTAVTA